MVALLPAAGIGFAFAEDQRLANAEFAADIGTGLLAHQRGMPAMQPAFIGVRKGHRKHVGNDEAEDAIAEKLQALIAFRLALRPFADRARMRQRAAKKLGIAECVVEPLLETAAPLLTVFAHRPVNILEPRTVHGHRQNSQALRPSSTEKKMTSARPIRFSNGT